MLKDLWNIGRILAIAGFSRENDADEANNARLISSAQKRMRIVEKQITPEGEGDFIDDEAAEERPPSGNDYREVLKWVINQSRERFDGHIIRRSLTSLDNNNEPITGLLPVIDIVYLVNLDSEERDALDMVLRKNGLASNLHHTKV